MLFHSLDDVGIYFYKLPVQISCSLTGFQPVAHTVEKIKPHSSNNTTAEIQYIKISFIHICAVSAAKVFTLAMISKTGLSDG